MYQNTSLSRHSLFDNVNFNKSMLQMQQPLTLVFWEKNIRCLSFKGFLFWPRDLPYMVVIYKI